MDIIKHSVRQDDDSMEAGIGYILEGFALCTDDQYFFVHDSTINALRPPASIPQNCT